MISQFSFFRSRVSLLIIAFIALGMLTMQACQPSDETFPTPEGPIISTGTYPTDILIYECVPVDGVELLVASIFPNTADLYVTGLNPNETITISFRTEGDDWISRYILTSTVDNDGEFSTTMSLRNQHGESPLDWQVQVIHARGVACATVEVINP
jgi:hypothetical protein